jgi:hypothetical protein
MHYCNCISATEHTKQRWYLDFGVINHSTKRELVSAHIADLRKVRSIILLRIVWFCC